MITATAIVTEEFVEVEIPVRVRVDRETLRQTGWSDRVRRELASITPDLPRAFFDEFRHVIDEENIR